jgi:hypothetical protein
MSKTGEQGKLPPPPLNEDGNLIGVDDGSNMETSTTPTVEELMKKLEKLNVELKSSRQRTRKAKDIPAQAKMMTPHLKRKSATKERRKGKNVISPLIMLCFLTMITCLALLLILSCPLAKLCILMGLTIINGSTA